MIECEAVDTPIDPNVWLLLGQEEIDWFLRKICQNSQEPMTNSKKNIKGL